jgi:hypothetical protein
MNKVTIELIESKIADESYLVLPDGRSTLCILTLENGYTIKGMSACVDPSSFDLQLGRQFSREDAIRQIWVLEGYLMAQRLYEASVDEEMLVEILDCAAFSLEAPYGYKLDGTPKKRPGRKAA